MIVTKKERASAQCGLIALLEEDEYDEVVDEGAYPSWRFLDTHPFPTLLPPRTRSIRLADILASDAENVSILCGRIRTALLLPQDFDLRALRKAKSGARTYYEVVIGEDSFICSVDNEAKDEAHQLECVFKMLSTLFGVDFVELVVAEEPAGSLLKPEVPTMVH